jgi:acetyltransferase-like isoleucine patch superfamily enzyme
VLGRLWIHGDGIIEVGDNVLFDGRTVPIELHARAPGSRIVIERNVSIEGGTSIEAEEAVHIGEGCQLGSYVKILDNNLHPLRGDRHQQTPSVPVEIQRNVCIEARAIVLPGAKLEEGVRVCAGSVVSRRVPAGLVVSGVPATRRSDERTARSAKEPDA